jgi:hypothetical protein
MLSSDLSGRLPLFVEEGVAEYASAYSARPPRRAAGGVPLLALQNARVFISRSNNRAYAIPDWLGPRGDVLWESGRQGEVLAENRYGMASVFMKAVQGHFPGGINGFLARYRNGAASPSGDEIGRLEARFKDEVRVLAGHVR